MKRLIPVAFLIARSMLAGTITVSLDTSALTTSPAGPFSLVFALTDGSGTGNANTTVTLTQFQYGGGAPTSSAVVWGGAAGDIGSTVTLTDTEFLSYLMQPFTPGSLLSFVLTTQANPEPGPIPDNFSFFITDSTGQPIPTQAGAFVDTLVSVAFLPTGVSVETFGGDPSRAPAGGGDAISVPTPKAAVEVSQVPEPAYGLMTLTALLAGMGLRTRKN